MAVFIPMQNAESLTLQTKNGRIHPRANDCSGSDTTGLGVHTEIQFFGVIFV